MKRFPRVSLICLCGPAMGQALPAAPVSALPGDAALLRHCDGLLSLEQTYALARHWIDS